MEIIKKLGKNNNLLNSSNINFASEDKILDKKSIKNIESKVINSIFLKLDKNSDFYL
jgi:hypothetical protein